MTTKITILIEMKDGGVYNIHGLPDDIDVMYMHWEDLNKAHADGRAAKWTICGDNHQIGGYHEVEVCATSLDQAIQYARIMDMYNIRSVSKHD